LVGYSTLPYRSGPVEDTVTRSKPSNDKCTAE
jgi:hypothetical protein